MTSIVKKVFRSRSAKRNGSKKGDNSSNSNSVPRSPPSPDFSGLTLEEVSILKDVLKRQDEFESNEEERKEKLSESLQYYEDEVKKSASQKSRLKAADLRLCKLCYRTKFADGIGKACYDCHKRVCNRCGAFSQPKAAPGKKSKSLKGKWRCNMCQMKRDLAAMTGVWYHGDDAAPTVVKETFKKKITVSMSEIESSENDNGLLYSTGTDANLDECPRKSDHSSPGHGTSSQKTRQESFRKPARPRRQTTTSSHDDVMDDREEEMDGEQFQRERQFCRMLRQSKKSKRKLKSGSSFSKSFDEGDDVSKVPISPSGDNGLVCSVSSSRRSPGSRPPVLHTKSNEDELTCNSDGGKSRVRHKRFSKQQSADRIKLHGGRERTRESSTERDGRSSKQKSFENGVYKTNQNLPYNSASRDAAQLDSQRTGNGGMTERDWQQHRESRHSRESRMSRDSRFSIASTLSRDSLDASPVMVKPGNNNHGRMFQRKHEPYYSSSSSVFSDVMSCDISDSSLPKPCRTEVDEDERRFAQQLQLPKRRDSYQNIGQSQSNNLSPQMALSKNRKRRNRRRRYDTTLSPNRSVSPMRASDQEDKLFAPKAMDGQQRRMTLSHCENIVLPDTRYGERAQSSKPHEIILHRDCSDTSVRTCGLGMRVVGGKSCPDGSLGAFVTMTTKNGPAPRQGISEGDQVLEWNGRSLNDVTFEEAQELISQSGNIVQITVIHNPDSNSTETASKHLHHPIIVRAGTVDSPSTIHPSMLLLNKPKRRMLPKTPVEIKRNVRQISGSIWMQLDYDVKCQCLLVQLLRGEDIASQDATDVPSPVVMLHLLPNRAAHPMLESEQKISTKNPTWNETFVFSDLSEEEIKGLALEVTVWSVREGEDEFLGEVLLDLGEASLDNSATGYHLEDHDDNSSPLPYRKKSFSLSDHSAISPVTSIETSSVYPSLNPSPRSSLSTRANDPAQRALPTLPGQEKLGDLMQFGKRSPASARDKQDRVDVSSSARSSPLYSPTSPGHEFHGASSFSSIVKKKMSAVARISSSLIMHGGKRDAHGASSFSSIVKKKMSAVARNSSSLIMHGDSNLARSHSLTEVSKSSFLDIQVQKMPRRSFESCPRRHSLLAPPHPLSRSNSSKELFSESTEDDRTPNPDRPAPEGDDITSLLGPGQIAPKVSHETDVCGDIKMGFMVSKGQLEIDIVVVKGLARNRVTNAPDTYVKTYLVEGSKTVQKKKTHTVKMNFDPIFRKTIKYSACNIHGRCIKVNVWEKQKTFDKKQCLGEAVVKLDSLDLSNHTMAWYKLFPAGATDFDSSESLNFWGYQ